MSTEIIRPKPPYWTRRHWEAYTFEQHQPHGYQDGMWWRALRLPDGRLVPTEVTLNENRDEPELRVCYHADMAEADRIWATDKVRWVFNTEYDLGPSYRFMDSDPVLVVVRAHQYGLKPCYLSTVYEAVITAIVQQQISMRVAGRLARRLVERFGDTVHACGKEFWEFPSAESLAAARPEDLRSCGLSFRKAEYIAGFSKAVASGEFDAESLRAVEHDGIMRRLTWFRGLGRWSAELVIVTSIGVEGVSPAGDLGARRAVSHFYNGGELMSERQVRGLMESWGIHKGVITYYLLAEYSRKVSARGWDMGEADTF